jgi:hypothetical protein
MGRERLAILAIPWRSRRLPISAKNAAANRRFNFGGQAQGLISKGRPSGSLSSLSFGRLKKIRARP